MKPAQIPSRTLLDTLARGRTLKLTLHALLMAALVLGTGCRGNKPRNHWWQFWRPKATTTTDVYHPDTRVLPPPGSVDPNGASGALPPGSELPPPPVDPLGADNEPVRMAGKESSELQTVYFDYDSAELSPKAMEVLDGNARWMESNQGFEVQIEGHTDERGSVEYNFSLGLRRAKSVKAYMESKGIAGARLHVISYGEERPIALGEADESLAQNRRAQFLMY